MGSENPYPKIGQIKLRFALVIHDTRLRFWWQLVAITSVAAMPWVELQPCQITA